MDPKQCCICYENFNKSIRKAITCILCDDPRPVCMSCFSKYLINLPSIAPKCMFCQREFTMDFVYETTNKTFMKQYKDHQFELQFSVEESRLPETQEDANRVRWNRDRERKLKQLRNQSIIYRYQMKMLTDDLPYAIKRVNADEIKAMNDEIATLRRQYRDATSEWSRLSYRQYNNRDGAVVRYQEYNNRDGAVAVVEPKAEQFIRSCPDGTCRGFLSTAYKCGTCSKYFCADCNEVKQSRHDEEHVCNEEIKATISLIKSDSKPCPKCAVMIYRSSGCPQMWCIQCHTTFDWNTGRIDAGYTHNPEYFRYLRERHQNIPRNPNDNACNNDRMPTLTELQHTMNRRAGNGNDYINAREYTGWYDYYNHVRWYILPNDVRQLRNVEYREYRVAYLNNELTKEAWKKQLKMKMKQNELRMERYFIIDMFCNVIGDLFYNLMANRDITMFQQNSKEIFCYTNSQMEKLNKKYGSKDTRFKLDKTDNRISGYFLEEEEEV